MKNLLIKAIKKYFSFGWEVFPCTLKMVDGKKKFESLSWGNQIFTEEMAIDLVSEKTNSIALKTGRRSDVWVLDIDKKPDVDGHETLKTQKIVVPATTPRQKTQSGGTHMFFRFPEIAGSGTTAKPKDGLDSRGNGGLIFLAPSHVIDGGDYKFEVKLTTKENLRYPPKELLALMFDKPKEKVSPKVLNRDVLDLTPKQIDWWRRDVAACNVQKGERSEADFKVCCTAIRLGIDKSAAWFDLECQGKFKERGLEYFEKTWSKADSEVPFDERPEYRLSYNLPEVTRNEVRKKENREIEHISRFVRANDIVSAIERLYKDGVTRGFDVEWNNLKKLYSVFKGQLTIISGIPSHGKSEFMDSIMVNLAKTYDWKFIVFSPENWPMEIHVQKIVEKYLKESFFGNSAENIKRMSWDDCHGSIDWIHDHFYFLDVAEDKLSVKSILDSIDELVKETKIDGVIIDPWNELESARDSKESETDYIGRSLSDCRRFARRNSLAFWIVAHPSKLRKREDGTYPIPSLYDISGSAHWYNKTDNGIIVWRDFETNITEIHVKKIKYRHCGKVGKAELQFDTSTCCFDEDFSYDNQQTHKGF